MNDRLFDVDVFEVSRPVFEVIRVFDVFLEVLGVFEVIGEVFLEVVSICEGDVRGRDDARVCEGVDDV